MEIHSNVKSRADTIKATWRMQATFETCCKVTISESCGLEKSGKSRI